jgi:hypothetical protein
VHCKLSDAGNTVQEVESLKFNSVTKANRAQGCSLWIGIYLAIALMISGCAGVFSPRPIDEIPFKSRAEKQTQGNLTVTAALPTRREARDIYGIDLGVKGMQPVWIEVKNEEAVPYWFLPSGLDPTYYSSSEVAYAFRSTSAKKSQVIKEHFEKLQFRNPILPGTTVSGFLVVHRDEGFKAVDVDLIARGEGRSFTYILLDPSFKGDYTLVDYDTLYSGSEIINIQEEEALRRALEQLPCCTTNKKGRKQGDPLNLVLIGAENDLFPAMIRRGWHGTEIVWSKAIWRTIKSFLRGLRYRYSPVSPLYVYGRRQDLAGQKARGTIHERNHLRLWMTPLRFRGNPVWIGQISRDIGVKLTLKSPTISTHVIDPDVDEARRYLIEDLAYSQALARFGYVKGVGQVSKDAPRMNLVGDPYYTDGLRVVMFFEPRPRTLEDVDFLFHWELPPKAKEGF